MEILLVAAAVGFLIGGFHGAAVAVVYIAFFIGVAVILGLLSD